MMSLSRVSLLVLIAVAVSGAALADGVLIPEQWPPPGNVMPPEPPPPFAIKYHHVDITIEGQLALTHIDQVFKSDYNRDMEATYLFPIPEEAAIKEFKMWMGNEPIPGKVLDADEARRIYEDIVRRRRDPGLLEYAGRGLFKAHVFPVPANGEARIEMEYTELLTKKNNTVRYTYPLDTERFSSKPIESVRISIEIHSDLPIHNVYSPSHAVSIRRPNDHAAILTYEETGTRPDTDLTVYYALSQDDIGLGMVTFMPEDEDGYFIFLASAPAEVQEQEIEAKDVIFVFDRTGSMSGEKIVQARDALKFCVRALNKNDRFNLIPFNEQPDPVFDRMVGATNTNLETALEHVDALDAMGGTNIDMALGTALPMLKESDRPAYVIFLTDGLPTVGVSDVQEILEDAKAVAPGGVRIFAFGVGYDVNTTLLDKLALRHKGSTEYVRPGEDIEVKVSSLFRMISYPILTDLHIDYGAMRSYDVFPSDLPDLFEGSQVILAGRFRGSGRAGITLSGEAQGRTRVFTLEQSLDEPSPLNDFIPLIWAQRKIGYLLEEIRLQGRKQELIDEIVRLSKTYGIITEYTSFLVEEPGMMASREYHMRAGRALTQAIEMAAESPTGSWAVNQSMNVKKAQKSANAPRSAQVYYGPQGEEVTVSSVRNIGNRAFFQQKANWIQSDYIEDQQVLKIKAYSKAQFQILEREPSLGELMALGEEVLFLVNGNAVQVGADGAEELTEQQLEDLFGT